MRSNRGLPILLPVLATLLAATAAPASELPSDLLTAADDAWAERADGARGDSADRAAADALVRACEAAFAAAPDSLEARWRLLRALYFLAEYGVPAAQEETRLGIHARGRDLAEEGIDALEATLGGDLGELDPGETAPRLAAIPGGEQVVFWGAVHWGLWARLRGKIASARQGVAGVIRDYASLVAATDERFEEAGGLRILGRLHTEAPKLPFVTGWIDRRIAVSSLERAIEIAPENAQNHLYLAEALLEHRRDRRDEALAILRRLDAAAPRPAYAVEEARVLADARRLLKQQTR